MIAGLDSSADAPTVDAAVAARNAGIQLWIGYMATRANVGLYATWQQWQFDIARSLGATPVAMCSGWDDPDAIRQQAAAWQVKPCLDCEGGGLRDDGTWVQSWLDAAQAGLYGAASVHQDRQAAFHILAWYPGFDPRDIWYPPDLAGRPTAPLGLQWQGTHTEFGRSVDRGWYDDWFSGGSTMQLDPTTQATIDQIHSAVSALQADLLANLSTDPTQAAGSLNVRLQSLEADIVNAVHGLTVSGIGVTPAQLASALRAAASALAP